MTSTRLCVECQSAFTPSTGRQTVCGDKCRRVRATKAEQRWRLAHPDEARDRSLRSKLRHTHQNRKSVEPVGSNTRASVRFTNDSGHDLVTADRAMATKPPEWDDPYALVAPSSVQDLVTRCAKTFDARFAASITATPSSRAYEAELCALDIAVTRWLERSPLVRKKAAARLAMRYAVNSGRLVPGSCLHAGADCVGGIEGHHENYDAPLDVIWLCRFHHNALHVEERQKVAA